MLRAVAGTVGSGASDEHDCAVVAAVSSPAIGSIAAAAP
jgi:hypothetical protein